MLASEQCPGSDELTSFQQGLVEEDRIEAIGEHIESCASCRQKLQRPRAIDLIEQGLREQSTIETEAGYRHFAVLANHWSAENNQDHSRERPRLSPPAPGEKEIGRLGHYRILRELGEGAMAMVYEAEDTRLHRLVALKLLKPYWTRTETARKRFLLEARASAHLVGDSIVPIFDVGEIDGIPYLAMALLRGQTLESLLAAQPRLPLSVLLRYARQIAVGLSVAHAHGLIHRDLKPANLWIESQPQIHASGTLPALQRTTESAEQAPMSSMEPTIKILDFGLARCIREDSRITQSGIVVGTPAYMAPEQARGDEVDVRSDLFSLGCILYRMATGQLPFQGKDTLSVFWALASKCPTPPDRLNPEVPGELSDLMMRLLAKKPAQRPSSAAALIEDLDRIPLERATRQLPWKQLSLVAVPTLLLAFWGFWTRPEGERVSTETLALNPLVSPAKVVAAKKPRNALYFGGKAWVEIAEFPFPANGPYTLEAYATPTAESKWRQVLIGYGKDNRTTALEISSYRRPFPTWRFSWQFPRAIGETQAAPNERFHLAAVFDNQEAVLYVNGQKDASAPVSPLELPDGPIQLHLGFHFVGMIDQVRISRGVRYRDDFSPDKVLSADADTLALYLFDEMKGDVLRDLSGHNRHGKIQGAVWKSR